MSDILDEAFRRQISNLECVKCGRKTRLKPYIFGEKFEHTEKGDMMFGVTKHYSSDSSFVLPVCEICKAEFDSIESSKICLRVIDVIIIIVFAIILIIQFIIGEAYSPLWIISMIVVFGGVIIYAVIGDVYDKGERSAKQYMRIMHSIKDGKMTSRLEVKPLNSEKWIDYKDWVKDVLIRRETD